MAAKKILVVEDEKALSKVLKYNLEKEGYEAITAADGDAGLAAVGKEKPDLILLDLMLPKKGGLDILKSIRTESKIPIIVLTARNAELDRVLGLELGADDYVTKPFSVRELMARVKAIFRRAEPAADSNTRTQVLRAGGIELDAAKYEASVRGKTAALSAKEFELLKCLMLASGRALSRDEILEKVWGYDRGMDLDTRTVDQHVARLREKLGPEAARVVTVKNVGYRVKND